MTNQWQHQQRRHQVELTNVRNRAAYQSSLWGDTYLTPQEARVYITQMLTMLRQHQPKGKTK